MHGFAEHIFPNNPPVVMATTNQSERVGHEPQGNLPAGVKLLRTLEGHADAIYGMAFDPQSQMLASGSRDRTVRLWNPQSGELLHVLEGHSRSVHGVAFHPHGGMLASASEDGTVRLWDPQSRKLLRTLERRGGTVYGVAFDPQGLMLASGGNADRVSLWDPQSGKLLHTFSGGSMGIVCLAFHPNGGMLAGGSYDNTARLWDPLGGNSLHTLRGHVEEVLGVSFAPGGAVFASASYDKTVRLWEPQSGKLLRTLEGHTGGVDAVTFSPDGALMASKSLDHTVRLWRCDTWEMVAAIPEPAGRFWSPSLAFHPTEPLLATGGCAAGAPDRHVIHLWELDLVTLLGRSPSAAPASASYAVAKVLLVGDTGVGKSGLAERLVNGRFVATKSSHARKAHVLESQVHPEPGGASLHRETVLWYLAGQPAYRLVHQLSMEDAALACVLFDCRSETNPFEGAAYWAQVLGQARTNTKLAKFLVASRIDVGGLPAGRERIEAFAREHGFAGFIPTSASTGEGCDELLEAIRAGIPWDDVPRVTTTETLAALREFVAGLKGEKGAKKEDKPRESDIPPLLSIADLHRRFAKELGKEVPLREFIAYLQRLEATDAVDLLVFQSTGQEPQPDDLVLLDPTRVDAYASALLVAAKDEPDGPGHLLESRVRDGDFRLDKDERLADGAAEKHVLWFVMENLLARDLALRERIGAEDYVVFPSQCTAELRFPGAAAFGVAFGFAGPVRSIYATLIAQLAHYEGFRTREFFQDAAAYTAEKGGRCLVRLRDQGRGLGELDVLFDHDPPANVRQGFLGFVGQHLEARSTPGAVTRRHAYHCANPKCGNPFEDRVVKLRLQLRKRTLLCPVCEKTTPLLDLLAPPTAASKSVSAQIGTDAKAGRQRMTAALVIKAKEAEGKFDVFLSHNSKDKAAVEKIARKLISVGLRPWFDKWNLSPGDTIMDVLEKAVKTIPCAALCFGPADQGAWHIMEIRAYVAKWAKNNARMIPVILPGAPDEPDVPLFVQETLWVNMRSWEKKKDDAFYRLVCGILRRAPGDSPLTKFGVRHVADWQGGMT